MSSLSNDNRFKYGFLKYYGGYIKKGLVKFYKLMCCKIGYYLVESHFRLIV